MADDKKYFTGLIDKAAKTKEKEKKMSNFISDRADLKTEAPINLAKGALDKDVIKTTNIDDFQEKIRRGVEEARAKRGLGPELENKYDAGAMRKEMGQRNLGENVYDAGEMQRQYKEKNSKKLANATENVIDMGNYKKQMMKMGTKGLKMLPLVGGSAAAMESGDAAAAIPILGEADSVGMSSDAENEFIREMQAQKDYKLSPAHMDRLEALKRLKNRE